MKYLIMNHTDYKFLYQEGIFKDSPKIKINKGIVLANDLLSKSLSHANYTFSFGKDNTVIIKPDNNPVEIQKITIKGKVTDHLGQPLLGVNIIDKKSFKGVVSDFEGNFIMNISDKETTLIISYIGFLTQEIQVNNRNYITIELQPEVGELEEVVVIGYGKQKKKDLTGSITTVDGEVLSKRNVTQLSQALQGTMPGIMVTRSSDEPGESASVRIRGITTIGDNSPLFIVDGVPIGNINYVNPSNIESVTVLKDAASASIYGARAAAGVILITTKRAKKGQINLEYTSNIGFDKPTAFIEKVGPQRYLEMINEWVWNDAGNTPGQEYALYTQDEVDNWLLNNQSNPNQYPITDWKSLLLKRQTTRQSHELVISAGGEKVKTRASVKYDMRT
ncbi:SusC/RagA family TonB-linked outer membrane protein [Wenyingzhuangia sp. 2_MG-2023]|uniref:SusC/RagA family TonB-linked outer membrane protein n=1 Tax=Wenyingzhuangia sp. 2_MG-2023 TaxID=3062639 RepID=UPI0026E12458|nr:SusC/RagA family TonB-linked outer membrane protein [Wenyingzhuangia sp. 2_MG-2023]MDO6738208.1 SusC/RagA family TonB-linked outer membrane protein [Wenyingzhuangia sp. 2_MG-2023]